MYIGKKKKPNRTFTTRVTRAVVRWIYRTCGGFTTREVVRCDITEKNPKTFVIDNMIPAMLHHFVERTVESALKRNRGRVRESWESQYLYFCTSKARKSSTLEMTWESVSSTGRRFVSICAIVASRKHLLKHFLYQ
jgi:hypothetical protein